LSEGVSSEKANPTLVQRLMKRKGNLYHEIYDIKNILLADKKASKGKSKQKAVIDHNKNKATNILKLHFTLRNKEYKTSPYTHFKIFEPKERIISRLPYFPDRICQHAIANIIEPILSSTFTADTYSAIKGRGIHKASDSLRKAIKANPNYIYCLKFDIQKFYPSVNNEILKTMLKRKIKCNNTLFLVDEIIDSSVGLPLGNYLSQPLANFYLSYFDHYLKEILKVKHVFRYCDDIVILGDDKSYLHNLFLNIKYYLWDNLKLTIKKNYQIFPIHSRGIDFVGYPVFPSHVRLRKRIKLNFIREVSKNKTSKAIPSYNGWIKHCDGKNLAKKMLN